MSAQWVIVHRDAPDTEREAAARAEEQYPQRALLVLRHLIRAGGDFDTRGADAMGMWLNSYAPARNALMRRGLVEDSGRRERNERGRQAIVWVPTAAGRSAARTGDLDVVAPPGRRKRKAEVEVAVLLDWAEVLAEALELVDPTNEVLVAWRAR